MNVGARELRHLVVACVALLLPVGGCASATPTPPSPAATPSRITEPLPTRVCLPPLDPIASSSPAPPPTGLRTPTSPVAEVPDRRATGLSEYEVATLESLLQIDDHPLYTMRFLGRYSLGGATAGAAGEPNYPVAPWSAPATPQASRAWACSLFAAMGGDAGLVYGRNFDWDHSPALLLFTNPPGRYASVSMVDIAYLVDGDEVRNLTSLSLDERVPLLETPYWPFDGMNEHGLVVGMAAVPGSPLPHHASRPTIGSLMAIRLVLDLARDTDEAVEILGNHNLRWGEGPPLHYLIADASGHAALVEFIDGQMVVLHSTEPYHLATNHLRAAIDPGANGACWRYDLLADELSRSGGDLNASEAMALLRRVSQPNTQWSVVYSVSALRIDVATGRGYHLLYTFGLRADEACDAAPAN